MTKTARFTFISLFALLFVLTQNVLADDVEVKIEKSPNANISGYRTYSWIPGVEKRTQDPRLRDSELDQRVREYVDRELKARGYQKENFTEPDFWVSYYAVIEMGVDKEIIRVNMGMPSNRDLMGGGSRMRMNDEIVMTRSYQQGTLLVDVIDDKENKLIWRASASAEVHEKVDLEKRKARLSKAVSKMMASYPQSQKKEAIREEVYAIQREQEKMRETSEERRDPRS